MGKKRVIKKAGGGMDSGLKSRALSRSVKRKVEAGILTVRASFNNTHVSLADRSGAVVAWSSSGSLGFKGAKKGTPYAAAKVGELIGDRASQMGVKEVDVIVRGVGSGRESSMRAFLSRGIAVNSIKDTTPVPFNGPRPPKPRRV